MTSSDVASQSLATATYQGAEQPSVSLATAVGPGQPILPWLLAALLFVLLALLGLRACSTPRTEPVAEAPPVVAEPVAEPIAPATDIALPGGTTLSVPPGSVGEQLFQFLSGSEGGSKTFLFDGLTFDSGQAGLDERSQATISAIAEILNAYGATTVSVDGYTDNLGSPAANQRLSAERAQAVADALSAAGVAADRMVTAGHGDANPVADNGTEEGRAQNRRTELTATKQ
jgi:outer membrane protein OmpA-like peptidoglycan-associated protein